MTNWGLPGLGGAAAAAAEEEAAEASTVLVVAARSSPAAFLALGDVGLAWRGRVGSPGAGVWNPGAGVWSLGAGSGARGSGLESRGGSRGARRPLSAPKAVAGAEEGTASGRRAVDSLPGSPQKGKARRARRRVFQPGGCSPSPKAPTGTPSSSGCARGRCNNSFERATAELRIGMHLGGALGWSQGGLQREPAAIPGHWDLGDNFPQLSSSQVL